MKLRKLIGTNAVIEENTLASGNISYLRLILGFIAVYFIGTIVSSAIVAVPQTAYYFNLPSVQNLFYSSEADVEAITKAIEEAPLPDWINVVSLFATVGTIAVVLFYCFKFEKRRAFGLGFVKRGAAAEYFIGLAAGAVMFSVAFGIAIVSGETKLLGVNEMVSYGTVALMLLGYVVQGASEEILMRSFFFVTASRAKGGVPAAVLLSALFFASLHLGNNGISPLAFLNVFLFGVFAAIYFLRRGSIWGIAAIHSAWNFTQGNIFGASVSGTRNSPALLASYSTGGIFSGGTFGPEGGLGVTIALVIFIAIALLLKPKEVAAPMYFPRGGSAGDFEFGGGPERG